MAIVMGIDIGQKRERSAICVVQTENREIEGRREVHFTVPHLERLPIGLSFPEIADRAAEVCLGVERRVGEAPRVFVDATGLGSPVVDLFVERIIGVRTVTPVYFNHGDQKVEFGTPWNPAVKLGKAFLVNRLQALLQTGRLHLSKSEDSITLAQELRDFEIEVDEKANERQGAFRVGSRDELVTALGLAVFQDPVGPGIY